MPIRFHCGNPECGRLIEAPERLAGRELRCPACSHPFTVPSAGPEEAGRTPDGDLPPADLAAHPEAAARSSERSCPECHTMLTGGAAVCPACGWVDPASVLPAGAAGEASVGTLLLACFQALAYGVSNLGSIFKLALYGTAFGAVLTFLLQLFGGFLLLTPGGHLVLTGLLLMVQVTVGGYYLRYFLDAVISSLEGTAMAPDVPPFDVKEMFHTGLRGLALAAVYVLPVISLPLLPLGFLAWAFANDSRALDLPWALRAAAWRPGRLVVLWAALVLWLAVLVAADVVLVVAISAVAAALGRSGCGGMLLALLVVGVGWLVLLGVSAMFVTVLCRCVGMLGRHTPALLALLPEAPRPRVTVVCVAGGLVVAALVWLVILPAILR